jgi:hypothetical protein
VALTVETAGALGLSRLEASRDEFWGMRSQLSDLQLQLETGLYTHLDESRLSYKAIVDEALALGISNLSDVIQTLPPSSEELDYENAVVEQQRLNGAFQELAGKLVSAGDMLASTIKDEFDPEFSLTTIDIGHGFLDQGRFEEAARTISEDLQIIDGRIESSIVELGDRVMAMTGNFNEVVSSSVVPVFESIGDADTLARCKSTVDELEAIARSVQGSKTLADMISIVAQSRKLADLAANMLTELRQKITAFEADNNRRSPAKYNWRNNGHTAGDVHELVGSIESMSSEPIVGSRFSVIETAVQAIGQQARVIKRYSQVNEFLMNYPNVEYMIQQRLKANKSLDSSELPVKPKYALEYLRMYAAENSDDVTFDPKTGILKNSAARRTPRNGNPK